MTQQILIPASSGKVIRAKRCETCACFYQALNGQQQVQECRAGPPQVIAMPVDLGGGRMQVVPAAAFPSIQPEGWCMGWRSRVLEGIATH